MTEGFPRPCLCDRFAKGKPFKTGQCRLCFMFHNIPFFRKLWSPAGTEIDLQWFADNQTAIGTEKPKRGKGGVRLTVKKSLPCIHVGEKLTMNEVKAINEKLMSKDAKAVTLLQSRSWHRCKIGLTANKAGVPGVACACEGCNSKCEGYKSS